MDVRGRKIAVVTGGARRIGRAIAEHLHGIGSLVPRPRVHLTRCHGVLAPNHHWRAEVTPAGRGVILLTRPLVLEQLIAALRRAGFTINNA